MGRTLLSACPWTSRFWRQADKSVRPTLRFGAQDCQVIAWVGTQGDELGFVLDIVQILSSFDRSQQRRQRPFTLPAKLIYLRRCIKVRWIRIVGLLNRFHFLEGRLFIAHLRQIQRQVGS